VFSILYSPKRLNQSLGALPGPCKSAQNIIASFASEFAPLKSIYRVKNKNKKSFGWPAEEREEIKSRVMCV